MRSENSLKRGKFVFVCKECVFNAVLILTGLSNLTWSVCVTNCGLMKENVAPVSIRNFRGSFGFRCNIIYGSGDLE